MRRLILIIALLLPFVASAQKMVVYETNSLAFANTNLWRSNFTAGGGAAWTFDSSGRPKLEPNTNSVTYYGAADGTDSTAAFQLAINNASNKTVFVPSGNYLITAPLTNLSGRTIVGEGFSSVLLGSNLNYVLFASNSANFAMSKLRVQGSNTVVGVYAKYANGLSLKNVQIDSCSASNQSLGTFGLTVWNSTNITVEACRFIDNGFDPGDTTNASAHVTGSMIFSGTASNECENITVRDCFVQNKGTYAVQFTDCSKVLIADCEIDQGNVGVAPHQNGYGINSYDGSHITGTGNREKKISIIDNRVYNCAGIGIYCVLGDGVIVRGNNVDSVALKMQNPNLLASGINMNECRRFTVSENVVCNVGFSGGTNTTAGIAVIAGEYGKILNNCITNVVSPTGDGINLGNYGQYTMRCFALDTAKNTIDGVPRAGVLTAGRALENCTFSGNEVYNSATHSFWFDRITRCVVENNVAQDYGAAGYGFFIPNTTATNWFNTFRNNKVINLAASRNGAAFRVVGSSNVFDGNIAIGIASIATGFQDIGGSNTWSGNFANGTVTTPFVISDSSVALNGNYSGYAGPPTNVPSRVPQMHLDTTAKSLWMATGTSSVDDWWPISNHGLNRVYNWTNSNVTWEFSGKGTENANLSTEGHWYITAGSGYGTYFGNTDNTDAVRVDAYGRLILEDGGSVGIGTNIPTATLHIHTSGTNVLAITTGVTGSPATPGTVAHWIPIIFNGTNGFIPFYK